MDIRYWLAGAPVAGVAAGAAMADSQGGFEVARAPIDGFGPIVGSLPGGR